MWIPAPRHTSRDWWESSSLPNLFRMPLMEIGAIFPGRNSAALYTQALSQGFLRPVLSLPESAEPSGLIPLDGLILFPVHKILLAF